MRPFACFSTAGRWYRGNCHCHTTLSDGRKDPAATAAAYREEGYDFLVLTDHAKVHDKAESLGDKDFLVIGGAELHCPPRAQGPKHHLVALGVDTIPDGRSSKTAKAIVRWVHRQGGLCYYAHPYWSGHETAHMLEGADALGVEVFNTVTEVTRGLGHAHVHWDQMLSRGVRWQGIAVDDTHHWQGNPFGGWIMVKARSLTKRAILAAMKKGAFYATQGPEIKSLTMKRNVVEIECSPVRELVWHGPGPYGRATYPDRGKTLSKARFEANSDKLRYLRVEVVAPDGKKAWSNPIWRNAQTGRWEG